MKMFLKKYSFSARAYTKVLKIARTIADLDSSKDIEEHHLTEAFQYRLFDVHNYIFR